MISEKKYSYVRGFNFQPPWGGGTGHSTWTYFDGDEYRRIIRLAKKAFPKLNTLRVWLSFDAWYDKALGREKMVENVRRAGEIIASEGLKMVPVYFNGWHSVPDFGGFTDESLRAVEKNDWNPYRIYLREVAAALETTGAVLMSDLSNEPLNNVLDSEAAYLRVKRFLAAMSEEIRTVSSSPVTVSSQGYWFGEFSDKAKTFAGAANDLELFSDIVDVFSIHPYSVCMTPIEKHYEYVLRLIAEADRLGKPVIITECCWDAEGDKARGEIVNTELRDYAKAGIGFLCHALSPSPVADLHEKDGVNPGFFMPFMYPDGTIRPYHDVFNLY